MVVSHLHVFPYTMAPTVCSPGSCQRRLRVFILVKSTHAAGVFTSDTGTPPTHTLVQLKSLNPVPLEMGKTRLGKFIKQ